MTQPEEIIQDLTSASYPHMAALDLGSNSFHLVVTRVVSGSLQIVHRIKERVHLADGLDEDGFLSQEAIERGLAGLKMMQESLQGFQPDQVRIVATYTLRKALNAHEFISRAKRILPYPIEVISGIEEARLIYSGVAHTQHDEGRRFVVDIGGGSTEFIIGDGFQPLLCRSLQMGCVSFTQRFFADGQITKQRFRQAVTAAQQTVQLIVDRYRYYNWDCCIGTSGTIKAILAQITSAPDAEFAAITLAELMRLRDEAITAGSSDALALVEANTERASVYAAGLAILLGIFKSFEIDSMRFSPAALREGVMYEMQADLWQTKTRDRTVQGLTERYSIDVDQAKRVMHTCLYLYEQVPVTWLSDRIAIKNILGFACLLHEVGIAINSRGYHRHSAYIIENSDLPGFNLEEQGLLALLMRMCRKKIKLELFPAFDQFSAEEVTRMLTLLRLAILLNQKRQQDILPEYQVKVADQHLSIKFAPRWLKKKPVFNAELTREQALLKMINIDLDVC